MRKCVDEISAGTLDPVALTGLSHLIVDEYQDLNQADIELIDLLATMGVVVFACGDDDQSIYSFRYGYPAGIQSFTQRHAQAGSHALQHCFRCATNVLAQANNLIAAFPPSARLPKNLVSVHTTATPPVAGQTLGWRFSHAGAEATAIAASTKALIAAGVPAEEILILVSSRGAQFSPLLAAMEREGIEVDAQGDLRLADSLGARFVYAALRSLSDADDYLALRILLGIRKGTGASSCVAIADTCLNFGLNFADQFSTKRSAHYFGKRELKALDTVSAILSAMSTWAIDDTLGSRRSDIIGMIGANIDSAAAASWKELTNDLPDALTLAELCSFLGARKPLDARSVLSEAYARILEPLPPALNPVGRVRIMTLHSCKGLTSNVVFVPGLEEELLPGGYRARYPAQVEEAARLLYVGLTRARVLNICSYSTSRVMNGRQTRHSESRFLSALGIRFQMSPGLTAQQIQNAVSDCANI